MGMTYRAGVVGSNRLKVVLLAAGALAVALPSLAHASPLPVPGAEYDNKISAGSIYSRLGDTTQEIYSPTTGLSNIGSAHTEFGTFSWSAVTTNNYGTPLVSASASADGNADAYAYSKLIYYIEFAGADGAISVPVQASGGTSYAPGFSGNASAQLVLAGYAPNQGTVIDVIVDTSHYSAFPINQTYTLQANEVYRVTLLAVAFAGSGYTSWASAWVDPYFGTPDGYTFLISDGIGNAPLNAATPIPATLPLFASGFGGLAYFARRRRRNPASAA